MPTANEQSEKNARRRKATGSFATLERAGHVRTTKQGGTGEMRRDLYSIAARSVKAEERSRQWGAGVRGET
jgi:hypothetical protein